MPTNWPPAPETYPTWPPVETETSSLSFSNLRSLIEFFRPLNFTQETPTTAETTTFFAGARCEHGDLVIGRMLVSSDGLRRWPFAVCRDAAHREWLVLWPPYAQGVRSGEE